MRTILYSREFPQGMMFDTEPYKADPLVPPKGTGWVEDRAELQMTTDQVVEAAVKQLLAEQSKDRPAMEQELQKKTRMEKGVNVRASALVQDKKILDSLDNKDRDGDI